jgi:hypothetical protein
MFHLLRTQRACQAATANMVNSAFTTDGEASKQVLATTRAGDAAGWTFMARLLAACEHVQPSCSAPELITNGAESTIRTELGFGGVAG